MCACKIWAHEHVISINFETNKVFIETWKNTFIFIPILISIVSISILLVSTMLSITSMIQSILSSTLSSIRTYPFHPIDLCATFIAWYIREARGYQFWWFAMSVAHKSLGLAIIIIIIIIIRPLGLSLEDNYLNDDDRMFNSTDNDGEDNANRKNVIATVINVKNPRLSERRYTEEE